MISILNFVFTIVFTICLKNQINLLKICIFLYLQQQRVMGHVS
jgi:hypothetical protein